MYNSRLKLYTYQFPSLYECCISHSKTVNPTDFNLQWSQQLGFIILALMSRDIVDLVKKNLSCCLVFKIIILSIYKILTTWLLGPQEHTLLEGDLVFQNPVSNFFWFQQCTGVLWSSLQHKELWQLCKVKYGCFHSLLCHHVWHPEAWFSFSSLKETYEPHEPTRSTSQHQENTYEWLAWPAPV